MDLQVSDEDLRRELQTGPFAQYLFPNGNFIGDDAVHQLRPVRLPDQPSPTSSRRSRATWN